MADGFGRLFKHYDYKHIQALHIVHVCYAKKCPQDLQGKISVTLINRFQNTIMIVWFTQFIYISTLPKTDKKICLKIALFNR